MGCDGGTIPRRDELVKVKKKPEKKDKEAELSFRWKYCAISQELLQVPVVACGLGRLYNKSCVIECLLNRRVMPISAKHIKSLKDVKDLNLTQNPMNNIANKKSADQISENNSSAFICPVTGLDMSGKFPFICLWTCGCVMAQRAIKQIDSNICHKCQKPFSSSDIIILNSTSNDLKTMKENMENRQKLQKTIKRKRDDSKQIISKETQKKKKKLNLIK